MLEDFNLIEHIIGIAEVIVVASIIYGQLKGK